MSTYTLALSSGPPGPLLAFNFMLYSGMYLPIADTLSLKMSRMISEVSPFQG